MSASYLLYNVYTPTGILGINVGVLGMCFNKLAPRRNLIAHQHGEYPVGLSCTFDGNLAEESGIGTHGGNPKLFGIHLTKPFVALNVNRAITSLPELLNCL